MAHNYFGRWIWVAVLIFCAPCQIACADQTIDTQLKEVQEVYREGERAKTSTEREVAFNEALRLYQRFEEGSDASPLLYNIGNCYAQLGEYGWALYYYSEAIDRKPHNNKAIYNKQLLRSYLGLPIAVKPQWLERVLFIHEGFSSAQKVEGAVILAAAVTVLFSCWMWTRFYALKVLGIVSALGLCLLLGSLFTEHFLISPRGVLVRESPIYFSPN
ncbi:MAG: tetratricopeptide repeat protein, partial [Chlamydiia bacterium]|nr:tetratricopeptide repeat protein [Chlamydiia bacterium]